MKSPKPPAPPPVVPLPQVTDDTVRNALRNVKKRKGRASTLVSGNAQLGDMSSGSTAAAPSLVSGLGSSAAYG